MSSLRLFGMFDVLWLRPQSGAIMTVLAAVCTKMPEAKLAIIFLPMFTFTAANVSPALTTTPPSTPTRWMLP